MCSQSLYLLILMHLMSSLFISRKKKLIAFEECLANSWLSSADTCHMVAFWFSLIQLVTLSLKWTIAPIPAPLNSILIKQNNIKNKGHPHYYRENCTNQIIPYAQAVGNSKNNPLLMMMPVSQIMGDWQLLPHERSIIAGGSAYDFTFRNSRSHK